MPTFTLQESAVPEDGAPRNFRIIPQDTVVSCTVENIKDVTKPWKDDDGNDINRVEFEFKVIDGEYAGSRIWGDTPTTFTSHPDCKLRNWLQEILGAEIDVSGTAVNTDDLIGNTVRVVVGNKRWKDKNTGQDRERHFAQDLLRTSVRPPAFDDPF